MEFAYLDSDTFLNHTVEAGRFSCLYALFLGYCLF